MKRLSVLLCLPMWVGAEQLTYESPDLIRVDAPMPEGIPAELPVLQIDFVFHEEAEVLALIPIPEGEPREESGSGVPTIHYGGGKAEDIHLGIWPSDGRVGYWSVWYSRLHEVADRTYLYPADVEIEGLPREQAVAQAQQLLAALGMEIAPEVETYTVSQASYAEMLEAVNASPSWLEYMPQRMFEPLEEAHEGYRIYATPLLRGLPVGGTRQPHGDAVLMLSRTGLEYLDTSSIYQVTGEGEPLPILPPLEALQRAEAALAKAPEQLTDGERQLIEVFAVDLCYGVMGYEVQEAAPYWRFFYKVSRPWTGREPIDNPEPDIRAFHVGAHDAQFYGYNQ